MNKKAEERHRLNQRCTGLLLHPTSLPGAGGSGELGPNAYWFVDFLLNCGFNVWQTLPLTPPHSDLSPYQAQSSHAGNPRLISIEQLFHDGWLVDETLCGHEEKNAPSTHSSTTETAAAEKTEHAEDIKKDGTAYRRNCLRHACRHFKKHARNSDRQAYEKFLRDSKDWLEDYALFRVFKNEYEETAWWHWKPAYRDRNPSALGKARRRFAEEIEQYCFEQFVFFHQWSGLKRYANERGIRIFGDLPIFVAADSADVWAGRENFQLNEDGQPTVVAGVPPDYFSATGQRWGNPHYDWAHMKKTGFQWWIRRMNTQKTLFDLVRIDHFRGFEAYWEIPAEAATAMDGRWIKAPGEALFKILQEIDSIPLVAEDLGVITPEVTALRKKFHIPGMKILQFAFDGGPANPYLPHNHSRNCVVYTGTHDNNTTLGWFQDLDPAQRHHVCEYLDAVPENMPWPLIRAALASVARLVILPMQDILACDGAHRMNIPGTSRASNWRWRFTWEDVPHDLHEKMRHLQGIYGRLP